jgi:predicted metal-binding membrane protein
MTSAPAMTAVKTIGAAALAAAPGLAAACRMVSVWQMTGMDMGAATRLGPLGFFTAVRVAMMAAMMLPGAARAARAGGVRGAAVRRVVPGGLGPDGCCGVRGAYRPHATAAAARQRSPPGHTSSASNGTSAPLREMAGSGFGFGLCCVGSSAGPMAMLVVLGVRSAGWMAAIAVLVTAQKLLPPGPPSMRRSRWRSSHSGL